MSSDIEQFGSISGELAKNLWGRTDFEKYDFGWAKAENWIVDYRGGLFSRPASEFIDIIEWTDGEDVKLVPFQFSPDTANTYLIAFTDDKVRFVQDGAYVLESDVTISGVTDSSDNALFTTSGAHGYSDGDYVKLSGFTTNANYLNTRTCIVDEKSSTTFELADSITGDVILWADVSDEAGVVNRIYTVTSPYGEEDLSELRATQVADYVRLTHPDYPIKNLIRTSATSWAISDEDIGAVPASPTSLAKVRTSNNDNYAYVYAVTAVDENGDESLADYLFTSANANFNSIGDAIEISWTGVSTAQYYNVYRSHGATHASSNDAYPNHDIGFIAQVAGTNFSDPGITPDFSRQPPLVYNPFANGRIKFVYVSTAGTGYDWSSVITWPGGGSGADGFLIVDQTGGDAIKGLRLTSGGEGYTGTSVTAADGSGAVMTASLSPSSGNNPHCAAVYQQRMVYGATDNNPLRLFGSYVGLFSNFNYTEVGSDDEGYEFDLDAETVAPIRSLVPVRGGILAFTQIGVWLISGSAGEILSGNNAQAEVQTSVGASLVPPVYLDSFVVYVSHDGQEIRMLAYDDYNKVYGGKNISLLSNHLFDPDIQVESLTFAPVPSKIVYATQDNGRMIALTVDNENNVYGATPQWTKGYYRYVQAITEDRASRVYVAVERVVNSTRVMYLERLVRRETFSILEDSFCLDSGLQLAKTTPAGRLTPSSFTGSVTFTTDGGTPFVSGDVGKVIRCGDGRATITTFTSSSEVDATWTRDLTQTFPGDDSTPAEFKSGDWTMDAASTTIGGLWHLEGEVISVLRDGTVEESLTVSDAAITISAAASRVIAGIPFTCTAQTLPPSVSDIPITGRRKDTNKVNLRVYRSIGLKIGTDLTKLKTVADRGQRLWSSDDVLRDVILEEFTRGNWERDAQIYFVQDSPRPVALLNYVRDTELGDDKE